METSHHGVGVPDLTSRYQSVTTHSRRQYERLVQWIFLQDLPKVTLTYLSYLVERP